MNLGLRREMLGDIVVVEKSGYLFCLDKVAGFICDQLTRVGRTAVCCRPAAVIPAAAVEPARRTVAVASERLDALLAAVYGLSRQEAQELLRQGRVRVDDRLTTAADLRLGPGVMVSVRGCGRFRYESEAGDTRRGRRRIVVAVY